jgi:hypothetical protein
MVKRLALFIGALLVSLVTSLLVTYLAVIRPMRRTWGVDPAETARELPGDDLVPDAELVETRGITILAPPSAIFPWLLQMGYGRGGWYSYDQMDNKAPSADRVMPHLQHLAVGDVMPTWPGGGFIVRAIEPERSLALYLDSEIVKAQQEASEHADVEASAAGVKVAGGVGGAAMPEFKASWVFVLEPTDDGAATRVIERLRAWTPEPSTPQKLALPMFGVGVFLMTRKQLLGLKERIERYAAASSMDVAA